MIQSWRLCSAQFFFIVGRVISCKPSKTLPQDGYKARSWGNDWYKATTEQWYCFAKINDELMSRDLI